MFIDWKWDEINRQKKQQKKESHWAMLFDRGSTTGKQLTGERAEDSSQNSKKHTATKKDEISFALNLVKPK